ncbi:tenascin-like [Harpegnathos saltator]|uniref:tenascin-like n=1 Tax=Harpegnathos saltator TaxID=610380 RepID=UPI00058C35CC|nr:tenascin-like [Harpegnathos saltator]
MTDLLRTVFVLCTLLGCFYCLDDPNNDNNNRRVFVGQNCQRDHDCIVNAFCRVQLTCQCEPYHSPSLDQSMCIATVGRTCANETMCASIMNGECKQGLCVCKDDFLLDITNSSRCMRRPVNIGDQCQSQAACKDSFGFASCINERCECFSGFHYVNETKTCIKSRGLFLSCLNDYECYLDKKSTDVLECRQHQCICKEGEQCYSKGSLITATGTLMMISFLLQQRIV